MNDKNAQSTATGDEAAKAIRQVGRKPRALMLSPLMALLVLVGCASSPALDTSTLAAVPAAFKEGRPGRPMQEGRPTPSTPSPAEAPVAVPAEGPWWKAFNDPTLDALVEQAGGRSGDVQLAASRLAQAQALVQAAGADRLPSLGVQAGASRGTDAASSVLPRPVGTQVSVGAVLGYELDLFGRLSGTARAAALDAASRDAALQATRLMVQASTAQAYLALRALDEELALMRQTVASYQGTERLVERRLAVGDVAELDLVRVRAQVASTESEALAVARRRAELEHALAVLVGEAASSFSVPPVDAPAQALPVIPAGVPATLLTRRPDVAAAQRSLEAAQARVGVARAAWFPTISLTAQAGHASPELGDLFKWSTRAWGAGLLMALPIFDGGRREAGEKLASADLDAAIATYRNEVLGAFRDVEDQLSSLRLLAGQAEAQARAVAAAGRASALSESRYRNGFISQLDLLDAQRSELSNRRQALQVRAAQYQATVGLIRALGGGWEVPVEGRQARAY